MPFAGLIYSYKLEFRWRRNANYGRIWLQSEFLSLELVDRKVRFAWDVGAGSTLVEHLLEIEPADEESDEKDQWYRVVAERYIQET